jgi:hypothetical protein
MSQTMTAPGSTITRAELIDRLNEDLARGSGDRPGREPAERHETLSAAGPARVGKRASPCVTPSQVP